MAFLPPRERGLRINAGESAKGKNREDVFHVYVFWAAKVL